MENKEVKRVYVSLVVSKQDKKALVAIARKRGLGISSLMRMMIKDFLSKQNHDT